ncbi:hypothetical protein [Rodentibacter caecimuris]|uniref:Gamma-glutamyl phosphate reductase n=1 Tax=Rodentibacter caecimuris TaxID=1796644 RepID=A0ABX3KW58_9PAST|nr:hypothetical protein BKG89_09665 [Rodentibacter heylii]
MSEQQSALLKVIFPLLTVTLLTALDFFMLSQQMQNKALPHLAVGILVAQLLTILIFLRGEICPGQRGRLIRVHHYLALYWAFWFIASFFSTYHYVLTDMLCICGLSVCYSVWKQPQQLEARQGFLTMAAIIGGLGIICYMILLWNLPIEVLPQFNPVAQVLIGIVLANIMLISARSRLQNWMALFPLFIIFLLVINALVVLLYLIFAIGQSAVGLEIVLVYGIYFGSHLMIAAVLILHSWKQWKLNYNSLLILLFISACLPIWSVIGANLV